MTYTTAVSASGYTSVAEQLFQPATVARELYKSTTEATVDVGVINAITTSTLFGVDDFIDGNKIIVYTAPSSIPPRDYELNQALIEDQVTSGTKCIETGRISYKYGKVNAISLEKMLNSVQGRMLFSEQLINMYAHLPRELYMPNIVQGMVLSSSPKLKGTTAGGLVVPYNFGSFMQPRVLRLSASVTQDSPYMLLDDLQSALTDLKQWRQGEMFILGSEKLKRELKRNAHWVNSPMKVEDTPIFSETGTEIGNRIMDFNFVSHETMGVRRNSNGQLVYTLIFGWNKAYAYAGNIFDHYVGDGQKPADPHVVMRTMIRHGGAPANPEALGVAYVTFIE